MPVPTRDAPLVTAKYIADFRIDLESYVRDALANVCDAETVNAFLAAKKQQRDALKLRAGQLGLNYVAEAEEAQRRVLAEKEKQQT